MKQAFTSCDRIRSGNTLVICIIKRTGEFKVKFTIGLRLVFICRGKHRLKIHFPAAEFEPLIANKMNDTHSENKKKKKI